MCVASVTMTSSEQVTVEVRLMSGQLLAELDFKRSEGLSKLRERVKEVCQVDSPYWLLLNNELLENQDVLDESERLTLLLVKRSASDLSDELVGFEGAAYRGDLQQLRSLLDDGASIDHRDASRLRTPLMWAAMGGQSEVCRQLLKHGANPTLRASGANAAQLAEGNGHEEVATMLKNEVERFENGNGRFYLAQLKRSLEQAALYRHRVPTHQVIFIVIWFLLVFVDHSVVLLTSLLLAHVVAQILVGTKMLPWRRKSKSVVAPLPHPVD